MNDRADRSIRELGATRLRLRGDLIFTPQTSTSETYYTLEDPMTSRFFRLGFEEVTFVSLLDGRNTIGEALTRLSTAMPTHKLSEEDAGAICRWLVEMDLAHTDESSRAERLAKNAGVIDSRKARGQWNPLVFRLPLCRPAGFFTTITPWVDWLYRPPAVLAWIALLAFGAYRVAIDWDRFARSSHDIFAPTNWLWLAGCWVAFKLAHEVSHGVVCKRYGGNVREAGVLFVLFAPLGYVDVTSSWRFRSTWQRVCVAAAGMYVELLIAAAAAIVWSNTDGGWLNNLCFNAVVIAGAATLAFNANPLMKFDGYYILSDLLGIPNLYTHGQQYLRYWARRHLLGLGDSLPAWPLGKGAIIRLYGVAALLWRVVVCFSLTIAAAALLRGAGIVLAFVAVVLWIGRPTLHFCTFLAVGKPGEQPNRPRFMLTTGLASTAAILLLAVVPWPGARRAPAVVEYAPLTVVRAGCAGFVREIHVESGQHVDAGQLIAELENREIRNELVELELTIGQSDVRCRQLEQQGRLAACQAELKKREGLSAQLAEKREQFDHLVVRAPRSGEIVRRDLEALVGTYAEVGDEIVSIGNEIQKELRVSISQDDLDVFRERIGELVRVDVPGHRSIAAELAKVIPRASLEPTHPALVAANGGPIPVKDVTKETADEATKRYELLAPRFTGLVRLDERESRQLRAGQVGSVSYRPWQEPIGWHLYNALYREIRERFGIRSRK